MALDTLDRLVKQYPKTAYLDEAQFRRGELLFALREYAGRSRLQHFVERQQQHLPGPRHLHGRGWSRFKQSKLDGRSAPSSGARPSRPMPSLKPASCKPSKASPVPSANCWKTPSRVTSISLATLQGAESIAAYVNQPGRSAYEFRVYEQLGELYLKQERLKDAADTFGAFARRQPLHAQAPLLQARVIDIYQGNGFLNQALEAKKDYVAATAPRASSARPTPRAGPKRSPSSKPTSPS